MADADGVGDLGEDRAPDPSVSPRLLARAIRERWALPPAARVAVLKRLARYVDPETAEGAYAEPRVVVSAARALIAADLASERLDLDRDRLELAREKLAREARDADGDAVVTVVVQRVAKDIDGRPLRTAPGPGVAEGGGPAV